MKVVTGLAVILDATEATVAYRHLVTVARRERIADPVLLELVESRRAPARWRS